MHKKGHISRQLNEYSWSWSYIIILQPLKRFLIVSFVTKSIIKHEEIENQTASVINQIDFNCLEIEIACRRAGVSVSALTLLSLRGYQIWSSWPIGIILNWCWSACIDLEHSWEIITQKWPQGRQSLSSLLIPAAYFQQIPAKIRSRWISTSAWWMPQQSAGWYPESDLPKG